MKLIIIGMDNTGKTTLVNTLSNEYKINKFVSPGKDFTREEMLEQIEKSLSSEEDLILERFSIVEELIYGNVLRSHSKFTIDDLGKYALEKYSPIFIYCRPSDEKIFDFGEREQMEGVIERSKELLRSFDSLISAMKKCGFDIIDYNFEEKSIEDLKEEINEHNSRKERNNRTRIS